MAGGRRLLLPGDPRHRHLGAVAPYPGAPWRAPAISRPGGSQAEARAPAPDAPNALPTPDDSRPEQVRVGRDRFEPYGHARPSTAPLQSAPRLPPLPPPRPPTMSERTSVWPETEVTGMKRSRGALNDLLGDSVEGHTVGRSSPESWLEQNQEDMRQAPTGKHARHTGRQPVEVRVDIGPRPEGCTKEVWHELADLHRGMGHPSNTSLSRMLARHGCRPEVLEFVRTIECSICIELSRPPTKPLSGGHMLRVIAFRDMVAVDEFFVTLTDGYRMTLILIMDVASRLGVTYPIPRPTTNIKAEELVEAVERAWLGWAGAMEVLLGDSAKPHIAEGVERFCRAHGSVPDITPGESRDSQAIVERRVLAWKEAFIHVNRERQLVEADRPWKWSSRIDAAMNSHLRVSGYSPYHFVFGGNRPRLFVTTHRWRHRVLRSTTTMRSALTCFGRPLCKVRSHWTLSGQ